MKIKTQAPIQRQKTIRAPWFLPLVGLFSLHAAVAGSEIKTLADFEGSAVCQKLGCTKEKGWSLKAGGFDNNYALNRLPNVTVELVTDGDKIRSLGVEFYDRSQLDKADAQFLALIFTSIGVSDHQELLKSTLRSSEKSVFQIKKARMISTGRFRIWAGKVTQQIVHIEGFNESHSSFQKSIAMDGEILLGDPKSKCKLIFKHLAVVVAFCPKDSRTSDIVDDFIRVTKKTGWRLPIFEVFNSETKAPKTDAAYVKLPEHYKYQSHTIQIDEGRVVEKHCYSNAKEVDCGP